MTAQNLQTSRPRRLRGLVSDVGFGPLPDGDRGDDRSRLRRLVGAGVPSVLRGVDAGSVALGGWVIGLDWPLTVALTVAVVLGMRWTGQYRRRLTLSVLNQAPVLALTPVITAALVGAVVAFHSADVRTVQGFLRVGAISSALILFGRSAAFALLRAGRRRGVSEHRVLVLGAGQVASRLVNVLHERREHGLRPVAVWDREPMLDESDFGVPVLGEHEGLASAIRGTGATVVIIAFARHPESGLVDVVRTCDRLQCEIFVVPRLFELSHRNVDMDEVRGFPLMRLRRAAFRTWRWHVKRLFDILVAGMFLLLLAPVMAATAAAVSWEGRHHRKPGILFRQRRIGLDGVPFELLKFRSLLPASETESATLWSVAQDHRVGPAGRFIRRLSVDELPQLWNVLRGDMTLVGPRPERPHFVERFSSEYPRYVARHRVPAGVTGWAQVHGLRGDTSIEERAAFDNYYIENWSLWLDVTILVRTVHAVFAREGS